MMVAEQKEIYFRLKDIEGEDDFLRRLIAAELHILRHDFADTRALQYADLVNFIDAQCQDKIYYHFHRTWIQVAQLRVHQYFLSEQLGRHANEHETIDSWKQGYHEEFARWYKQEYLSKRL